MPKDVQSPHVIPWSPPLGHNIDSCIIYSNGQCQQQQTNVKALATLITVHMQQVCISYLLFITCLPTDFVSHLILYELEECAMNLILNLYTLWALFNSLPDLEKSELIKEKVVCVPFKTAPCIQSHLKGTSLGPSLWFFCHCGADKKLLKEKYLHSLASVIEIWPLCSSSKAE